jgi:hypothetical protein
VNFLYRMALWDLGFIAAVYIRWGWRAFIEWARVKPGESTHNST